MDKNLAVVLVAVVGITLASAGGAAYLDLAYAQDMPPAVSAYVERLSSLFMAGAGAIIALLGAWGFSGRNKP
jgi:hypothetical protein